MKTKELTEKECWFWLDNLQGIGKVKRRKLLEKFQSAKGIYEAKKEELRTIPELRTFDLRGPPTLDLPWILLIAIQGAI